MFALFEKLNFYTKLIDALGCGGGVPDVLACVQGAEMEEVLYAGQLTELIDNYIQFGYYNNCEINFSS